MFPVLVVAAVATEEGLAVSLLNSDPVTAHVTAGLAVLEMLAVTEEGSCLAFDLEAAVARGPEGVPLARGLVNRELAALCPALAPALALASASDWSQPPPAVHAEALNPLVQPDGACRASLQALAKKGAPARGHAVHAEVPAVPAVPAVHAVPRSVPAMAAVALKWLVGHPMWKAECQMAQQQLSLQGQSEGPQLFVEALE